MQERDDDEEAEHLAGNSKKKLTLFLKIAPRVCVCMRVCVCVLERVGVCGDAQRPATLAYVRPGGSWRIEYLRMRGME